MAEEKQEKNITSFPCKGCGGDLAFKPGTNHLVCPYCGADNKIEKIPGQAVAEQDLQSALEHMETISLGDDSEEPNLSINCESCGAEVVFDDNQATANCPFCGSHVVAEHTSEKKLKPHALLPFGIDKNKAKENFRKWLSKRWFAPNKLKKYARSSGFTGVYCPYWTYDADTDTRYTGQRGDYYYVTETYTAMEDGKPVTKTRQVRHTRWSPASGRVSCFFDDVLVEGTSNLPVKLSRALEPWDLHNLVPFTKAYLSGFAVETYTKDIKVCYEEAKELMYPEITSRIKRDIGGDEQRISSTNTTYSDTKFKHVLLPLWISSYRFRGKVYRFLVNARTGEVQGERPWSIIKIAFAVLVALALIGGGLYLAHLYL